VDAEKHRSFIFRDEVSFPVFTNVVILRSLVLCGLCGLRLFSLLMAFHLVLWKLALSQQGFLILVDWSILVVMVRVYIDFSSSNLGRVNQWFQ
jgi:hypothetical protein